ncbi:MAG TPA: hypothetical protein VKO63_13275, partial [Chitinispirillaceae bacterium]|nr:hypothetical protein [Chitinispirillaceae bacterium]
HLMGASSLQTLQDDLPLSLRDNVDVTGKRCLGLCSSNHTKAPYVLVNDEVLDEASLPKIIEKIEKVLKEK